MKLFWWLVKISLFGLLIFLVACDGSSNSRPKAPIDGNSRPDAELLSLPFDVANDKSREILLSQIKVLKSRIKPLDKKSSNASTIVTLPGPGHIGLELLCSPIGFLGIWSM